MWFPSSSAALHSFKALVSKLKCKKWPLILFKHTFSTGDQTRIEGALHQFYMSRSIDQSQGVLNSYNVLLWLKRTFVS